jgi:hypothetical protein
VPPELITEGIGRIAAACSEVAESVVGPRA